MQSRNIERKRKARKFRDRAERRDRKRNSRDRKERREFKLAMATAEV